MTKNDMKHVKCTVKRVIPVCHICLKSKQHLIHELSKNASLGRKERKIIKRKINCKKTSLHPTITLQMVCKTE
jgi:hypothetical protein